MRTLNRFLMLSMITVGAAACAPRGIGPATAPPPTAGIANPASVFCESNGGKLDLRTGTDGGVTGICMFPDGSECEEWSYFRGECKPGASPSPAEASAAAPTAASQVPVALQVVAPQDGEILNTPQLEVQGLASPGAVVTVNDDILLVGPDGKFQSLVTLEQGPNLVEIVASNDSGAEANVELTVIFEP
jgi:putative hemolysin